MIAAFIKFNHLCIAVVNTFEITVDTDRPVDRYGPDAEHLFHFLHQGKWIFAGTVHFVDECENRNIPKTADLKQLYGLGLNTLGSVNQHDSAVCSNQNPVGILRKVLVARCIQNIDVITVELKLHGGGGYGDTALLLNFHPV